MQVETDVMIKGWNNKEEESGKWAGRQGLSELGPQSVLEPTTLKNHSQQTYSPTLIFLFSSIIIYC